MWGTVFDRWEVQKQSDSGLVELLAKYVVGEAQRQDEPRPKSIQEHG